MDNYVDVDPWEHVLGMGLGAVFVNQLLKWEVQLEQDLDKMLEKAKAANERRYVGNSHSSFPDRFWFSKFHSPYYIYSSNVLVILKILSLSSGFQNASKGLIIRAESEMVKSDTNKK